MNSTKNYSKRPKRWLVISVAVFLILIGTVASFLRMNEITTALGLIFTVLGALLPLFSKGSSESPNSSSSSTTVEQKQTIPSVEEDDIPFVVPHSARGMGIIVVYMDRGYLNTNVNLTFGFGKASSRVDDIARIEKHRKNKRTVYAALFRDLPASDYTIRSAAVEIEEQLILRANQVLEIDWRGCPPRPILIRQQHSHINTNGV